MNKEKNKKRNIIVILIITIIIVTLLLIYLNNRIVDDNSGFTLKKNLKAEVYSEIKVQNFIKNIEGKILSEDKIDNERLGKQEVSFIYLNKDDKKRRGTFTIKIVDMEKPVVWLQKSYSTPLGKDIDFEKNIVCVDNYDNSPICTLKGQYDINTPGTYNLSFIAQDSSKNKVTYHFDLIVYDNSVNEEKAKESSKIATTTTTLSGVKFSDMLNKHKSENTELGIDVSKHQGTVDFEKVKNAGASFVMIRVGYQVGTNGEYKVDPYFKENIKSALKNDLKVGVYFYSYADSEKEAKKQARWVIKQIKDYDISLPIVFDFESFNAFNEMELSIFGLNEVADSFINTIDKAGYQGMLYGSKNYLNTIWKYHTKEVWLAHYTDETDYTGKYMMWQLCDDGLIDGIDGYVDINVLYK